MTQEFKDHIVQHPNRFKRVPVAGTTDQFDLIPTWQENPSEVVQLGTPIDRQLFEGITSQLADIAINIKTFGAKSLEQDASFDSTMAIRNAIASLGETGGLVLLPRGTFKVSDTITIPSKVTLKGQGKRSTIIDYRGDNDAFRLSSDGVKYVGMEGIYVTNNGTSPIGLLVTDSWYGKFRDLVFDGFKAQGLTLKTALPDFGVYWNTFEEVDTPNSTSAGIVFQQSGSGAINLNTFLNCRFNHGHVRKSPYGAYLQNVSCENVFISCDFSYSTSYNLRLEGGASRNLFQGCYSEQTTSGTSKGFSADSLSKSNKYYGGIIYNNSINFEDESGTNEIDSHDGTNPIKKINAILPFGRQTMNHQQGNTGNLSVTTSLGKIGAVTFLKEFPSGIVPDVQLTLSGMAQGGQVTIVKGTVTNTGFDINGVGSIANTVTVAWSAIG